VHQHSASEHPRALDGGDEGEEQRGDVGTRVVTQGHAKVLEEGRGGDGTGTGTGIVIVMIVMIVIISSSSCGGLEEIGRGASAHVDDVCDGMSAEGRQVLRHLHTSYEKEVGDR
jgi:hypothetical protein